MAAKRFCIFLITLYFLGILPFIGCSYIKAQCSENIEYYSDYFRKKFAILDPIEGVWQVDKTIRIYQGKQLKQIKKENNPETWIITKSENFYIACQPNIKNPTYKIEFSKKDSERYIFTKIYNAYKEQIIAYAICSNNAVSFSCSENQAFLKEILGNKYNKDLHVFYDFELTKIQNQADKIKNYVPKLKNWFIETVKSFFSD